MEGFTQGSIVFDATRSTWMIVDKGMQGWDSKLSTDFTVIGEQFDTNSKSIMPTGLQSWKLFDENCKGERKLMLSPVSTKYSIFKWPAALTAAAAS